jgi:hypothetical protein
MPPEIDVSHVVEKTAMRSAPIEVIAFKQFTAAMACCFCW